MGYNFGHTTRSRCIFPSATWQPTSSRTFDADSRIPKDAPPQDLMERKLLIKLGRASYS